MPEYRRTYQPGGTFFFTIVTAQRAPILSTARSITFLREALAETKARWPFEIVAAVILPEHLHTVWTLPTGDAGFSIRWAYLKLGFAISMRKFAKPSERMAAASDMR